MTNKKLNVLSVEAYELSFGGDETRLLNQIRLLNKDRFNCIICTPASSGANMTAHFENEQVKVIYIKTLPFNVKKTPAILRYSLLAVNALLYTVQLLWILYREKIDVMDSRLLAGGIYGLLAKKITGIPVMVTLYHKSAVNYFLQKLSTYLLRSSDAIICDSQMRLDELREWIASDKPEYLVIPSPIELKFSYDDEIETIKKNKPVSGKIIIGQIAGIIPFKGQDLLINAFHTVAQKSIKAELWIIGFTRDHHYYALLQQQVRDLSLHERVRFLSYPDYIGNVFEALDIQVHASRFDSLPNSILEGMSVGKPLIASSVGGIPEVIDHGETGLLFETDNQHELSHYMDQLIGDSDLRGQLGHAAKRRFQEKYAPAFLAQQIEDIMIKISKSH